MQTIQLPNLKAFCDPNRETIAEPFSEGGWTYYATGSVIVRVARDPNVPERLSAPKNVDSLIFQDLPVVFSKPLSELDVPKLEGPQECDNCGGCGQCDCTCGTTHECGQCKGTGRTREKAQPVAFNRHQLSHVLLNKIKTLPNVVMLEYDWDPLSIVGFTFDGGQGRIAPMRT